MSPELVAALIGVAGVVVGFFLSEVAVERRRKRERKETREAVRAVLRLEIERNLGSLRGRKPGQPLPTQSNQIWESQLPSLHAALSAVEIQVAHDFYYELYNLRKVGPGELDEAVRRFLSRSFPLGAS